MASEKQNLSDMVSHKLFTPGRGKPIQPHASTPRNIQEQSLHYNVTPFVPKLPLFTGDEPLQKGDCIYTEWRYEVRCLLSDPECTEHGILLAIRRSLKGTARKIMIPLGENACSGDILEKLDAMFGDVSTNGMIMQEFFNAQQLANESVTSFGCRLETLLQSAIDKGHLTSSARNDLLRHKFWTSLSSEKLKAQTRHKYDSVLDYNSLLREIRQVEKELSISSQTSTSKARAQANGLAVDATVESRLKDLESALKNEILQVESRLQSKYDSKLDQILQRLDGLQAAPAQPTPSYKHNNNKGRGRGWGKGNNQGVGKSAEDQPKA
jgi:hypothetical protein